MIIAMPADEKTIDTTICISFGRAPYLLFYNTITKESEILDNSAVASQGGAGIRVAQVIADHGVKALLTYHCGENAESVLSKAEVLIYKAIPGTIQQNIDAFMHDQLNLLTDIHPGLHGKEIH
ncbi:MAG: NifB/NifX family molybdenum-iron cluster-binding protein [Eubacteriales bacterium]